MKQKKTGRRALSILLSLVLILGMLPDMSLTVYADTAVPGNGSDAGGGNQYFVGFTPGTAAGNYVYSGDQNAAKLFDGNGSNKICCGFNGSYSIEFSYAKAITPKKYYFRTGGDTADYTRRNPSAWKLYGKNSSGTWDTLDTKTGQSYTTANNTAVEFSLSNTASYKDFKLEITAISSGSDTFPVAGRPTFQLSEFYMAGTVAPFWTDKTDLANGRYKIESAVKSGYAMACEGSYNCADVKLAAVAANDTKQSWIVNKDSASNGYIFYTAQVPNKSTVLDVSGLYSSLSAADNVQLWVFGAPTEDNTAVFRISKYLEDSASQGGYALRCKDSNYAMNDKGSTIGVGSYTSSGNMRWNFIPITYTVKYDANGGTGTMTDQTIHMDSEGVKLAGNTFTRAGYTFKGWKLGDATTGTNYADQASVSTNLTTTEGGVATLYAQWEKIPAEAPVVTGVSGTELTYGYTEGSVSVAAEATAGHELSYQWYSNTTNSNEGGTVIAGATSAQYTVPTGKNVGTYYYYCLVTAKRSDNGATNAVVSPVAAATVQKAPLTVKANDKTIVYGDEPTANGVSYSGFANGETEAVLAGTLAYDINYEQYGNAGAYAITPKGLTSDNYEITYQAGTLAVAKKPITIAWTGDSYVYDGKTHGVTASARGTVNGDVLTLTLADDSKTDAGIYTAKVIAIGGAMSGSYEVKESEPTASHTWTITQADNQVQVSIDGWTYGKTVNAPTAEAVFGIDTVTYTYSDKEDGTYTATVPTDAGTYYVKAEIAETPNYKAASDVKEFEIKKAEITITADDLTSRYGSPLLPLTCQIGGDLVAADEASLRAEYITISSTADPNKAGYYPIKIRWKEHKNYTAEITSAVYIVSRLDLTVMAEGYTGVYDGKAHGITVDIGNSDAKVYYSTEKMLTMANYDTEGTTTNPVFTNVGKTRVYYYVATNNYNPTPISGQQDIEIKQAPLTITANDQTIVYGDAPAANGVTYSGFVNEETEDVLAGTLAYDINYEQYGNAGAYVITPKGLTSDNYEITYQAGTLTVAKKPITIAWTGDSYVYDGKAHGVTASVQGTVNKDVLTLTLTEDSKTDVGTYIAKVTAVGGEMSGSYELNETEPTVSHTWTITQADNQVQAAIDGWVYGETANAPTAEAAFGIDTVTYTYSDQADGVYTETVPVNAGTYYVKAEIAETPNYKAASDVKEFVIAKAPLTITANDQTIVYGDEPAENGVTYSGLVNEETEDVLEGELTYDI